MPPGESGVVTAQNTDHDGLPPALSACCAPARLIVTTPVTADRDTVSARLAPSGRVATSERTPHARLRRLPGEGGTGKSSVAVNLAVAFQQQGQRVLLIDLDAQGHASRWLGVDPRQTRADESILGVIRGRPMGEGSIVTEDGVAVVPAHPEMAGLPVALASAPNNGLFALRSAVAQLVKPRAPVDIDVCYLPPAPRQTLSPPFPAAHP